MKTNLACLLLLASSISLRADVTPAFIFQDNAVLQSGRALPVWGIASPGEAITITYEQGSTKTTVSTKADALGSWGAELAKLPANAQPATLTFQGRNTITRSNILVGEVWIASGQSNMEWPVGKTNQAEQEIASADLPLIRHIKIMHGTSDQPQTKAGGQWQVASPKTAGMFSATAFYYARELHAKLKVPIGIIDSTWGGSPIEAWMSSSALASNPSFAQVGARWKKRVDDYAPAKAKYDTELAKWTNEESAAKTRGDAYAVKKPVAPMFPFPQNAPSALYNAMIHPLPPYSVRGVIWYQGESNVGRADEYRLLFVELISSWRAVFRQPDLPFYWVQLANYGDRDPNGIGWALLREAQDRTQAVPHTGQALAIDIGDASSVHPGNKQEVGRRLARLAFRRTYGDVNIHDSGPVFDRVEMKIGESELIRVHFKGNVEGLRNRNTEDPDAVLGFEVAGADKKFQPVQARIENSTAGTVLLHPDIPSATYVRYAWRNDPKNSLVNSEGLPVAPFRTDL